MPTPATTKTRAKVAAKYATLGFIGGGIGGTIGYLALVSFFDFVARPTRELPFPPIGILALATGMCTSVHGLSLSIIPFKGWPGYLVLFAIPLLVHAGFFPMRQKYVDQPQVAAFYVVIVVQLCIALALCIRCRRLFPATTTIDKRSDAPSHPTDSHSQ